MKRILIVGDSLPFSRHHKGQPLGSAWPELLQTSLTSTVIYNRAKGGSSSFDVIQELSQLLSYYGSQQPFDAVISQFGIVDACPRSLPRWFIQFLSLNKTGAYFLKIFDSILGKFDFLRIRRPWIPLKIYQKNCETVSLLARQLGKTYYPILIMPAARFLVENEPRINNFIIRYNEAAQQVFEKQNVKSIALVPPNTNSVDYLFEDGHHLNDRGHVLVAERVTVELFT